jgi:hypothetical protein
MEIYKSQRFQQNIEGHISPERVKLADPIEREKHLCYICRGFAIEPKVCSREMCKTLFCEDCIKLYIKKKPLCPHCRIALRQSDLVFTAPTLDFKVKHLS